MPAFFQRISRGDSCAAKAAADTFIVLRSSRSRSRYLSVPVGGGGFYGGDGGEGFWFGAGSHVDDCAGGVKDFDEGEADTGVAACDYEDFTGEGGEVG